MSGCFTPGRRRRGANRKEGGRRSALRCWSSALGASVPGVGGRCRGGGCRRSVLRCRSRALGASVSGVRGWYRDAGRRREVLRCSSSNAGLSSSEVDRLRFGAGGGSRMPGCRPLAGGTSVSSVGARRRDAGPGRHTLRRGSVHRCLEAGWLQLVLRRGRQTARTRVLLVGARRFGAGRWQGVSGAGRRRSGLRLWLPNPASRPCSFSMLALRC